MSLEAIRVRPPHGQGTSDKRKANIQAVSSSSTSAVALGLSVSSGGEWVTLVSTEDAHIRFGTSGVGAATTSDYFLPAGQERAFYCLVNEDTHFRVIRATADGNLHWYISG